MHILLKNKQGFTLLEALMGMFVMSVLMVLILQMVIVLNDNMVSYYNKRQDLLFIMQTHRDIIKSSEIEVVDNALYFTTFENEEISYSLYNNEVIRKVNNAGFEVVLSNVESIAFYEENNNFYMEVKHFNEKEKEYFIGTNYY